MLNQPNLDWREEFERQVRDALGSLFDLTALQTHPLLDFLEPGPYPNQSRGEYLRGCLQLAMSQIRPSDSPPNPGQPEWRPFIILNGRYVEGKRIQDIQNELSISERQFRREHGRAIQAVSVLLMDRYGRDLYQFDAQFNPHIPELEKDQEFPIEKNHIDIFELVNGVIETIQPRAATEGIQVHCNFPQNLPAVATNRVILRQVLIGLLSFAISETSGEKVSIVVNLSEGSLIFSILCNVDQILHRSELAEKLKHVMRWAETIRARVSFEILGSPGEIKMMIWLPNVGQPVLMVVDDQETAIRMYQRYLSQTNVRLVGVRRGSQVIESARELRPDVIALDVMLPDMDGWEVLQSLRANPVTKHIPIIICTVWEEPELANSLGATDYLKKPISQKAFLDALARFGLV